MDNAVHVPAPPSVPGAEPVRIRHVDSLRAVAAGLVMWAHLVETLRPRSAPDPAILGLLHAVPGAVDLGRVGVMIFFAVSGFVICRSFGGPRAGGARRFLIKRGCRLYPAYWASLLGGMLVWRLGGRTLTGPVLAANATMLSTLFGQPRLLGLYWTLEVEWFFYALCLGLYLARGLDRAGVLAACAAALALVPRGLRVTDRLAGTHLGLTNGRTVFVVALAVMCWGAVFRLVYDGTGGFRRGVFTHRGTALLALLTLVVIDVPDPNLKWVVLGMHSGPLPGHVSVVYALAIFTLWVACLRVDNTVLTYLGLISYSLYLFHPVPLALVARVAGPGGWHLPLWVGLFVCAGLSVAVAACSYRWVERPAIALGRRWAGASGGRS